MNALSEQEEMQAPPYGAGGPPSNSADLEKWAQIFIVILIRQFSRDLVSYFSSVVLKRESDPVAVFRRILRGVERAVVEMECHLDAGLPPLDGPAFNVLVDRTAAAFVRRLEEDCPALTPTQILVMQLLNDGLSGGQVAKRLTVSEKTVRTHVRRVIERLQALGFTVRGMRDALAILRSFRLVDDRSPR